MLWRFLGIYYRLLGLSEVAHKEKNATLRRIVICAHDIQRFLKFGRYLLLATKYKTLDIVMGEARYRSSGFDYMRLILSIAVVVVHSNGFSYGAVVHEQLWASPARPVIKLIVPMFFALSGFLVAGSMERSHTLINFMGLRFIRIYPALAVEVLLSAFLIGPLITTVPLSQYFTDDEFLRYLVNITGHISYHLPGVFDSNPLPRTVNAQLWTVPFELACYIVLAILIAFGLKTRRWLIWLALLAVCGRDFFRKLSGHGSFDAPNLVAGGFLVPFFLCGVAFYLYRTRIPFRIDLFIFSAILSVVLFSYVRGGEYLGLLPATYLTVYLGLCNPARTIFSNMADYSYGIFLYGAVIQQTIIYLFPNLREWYWNVLIALPVCFIIGWFSWNFVEKPMMGFRTQLKGVEDNWIIIRDKAIVRLRDLLTLNRG